jgi:hypothetical protein
MYTPGFHFCDVYVCVHVCSLCVCVKERKIIKLTYNIHTRTHTRTPAHTHTHTADAIANPEAVVVKCRHTSPTVMAMLGTKTKIQKSVKCRHTAPTVMAMLGTKIKILKSQCPGIHTM